MPHTIPPDLKTSKPEPWYFNLWGVLILLACLGPLAFPLLWGSKQFSLFWKWMLTLAITAMTAALLWSTWMVAQTILRQFQSAGLI
ncbi:MAG: hypothetical protein A3A73_03560 [Omnitrophica bacterium RIFCSPLOWO2_01_FULL_50_24]|nr:MAG: hypothetical protein A3A73_03560 [Omnitrophica bacterium RIFCSPLOWO2_01_FULL_50_24]